MHKHNHCGCNHNLEYCPCCGVVYCTKCGKEWYPNTITWYKPTWDYSDSPKYTSGYLETDFAKDNPETISCTHGNSS